MALSDEDKLYIKELIDEKNKQQEKSIKEQERNTKFKDTVASIYKTSVIQSAKAAIMYSNPLTALIAQNEDLLKGVGKLGSTAFKGLSSLLKKRKNNKEDNQDKQLPVLQSSNKLLTQKAKLLPKLTLTNGTNYIAAKQAVFQGGKNYINVSMQGKTAGMFSLPQIKQPSIQPNLLGNTSKSSNVIEMSKGIDGIYKSTRETSKILSLMNKRVVLISTGILLGVGAIIGLVNWLKGKFGGQVTKAKEREQTKLNNAVKDSSILTFKPEAQAKRLQQQTNSGISGVSETKKTFGDTFATEAGTKAFKFNSKEQETKILAPWDGRLESATIGDYGYTFKGKCKNGKLSGNFVIVGVGEPYIAPGEKFKKGQLLGTANGDSFKIVADMNEQQAIDYQNMVNEAANNNYATQLDDLSKTDKKTNTKRMKYYDKLSKSKAKDVGLLETANNIINNGESIKDQINLPTITKTPTDNVNTSNKNETLALQNTQQKKSMDKPKQNTQNITKTLIASTPSSNDNLIFGIIGNADIKSATSTSMELNC